MRRRIIVCVAVALAALLWTPAARAGWFAGEPVDGRVTAVGGLDLARDGTGALTYVKAEAGVAHVFAARLVGGAFSAPERVDVGIAEPGSDPVVAAASGGRLLVAWRSAGRVLGAFSDGAGFSTPAELGARGAGPPDVDLAIQGTGFVTFSESGDVRAVRLRAGRWEAVGVPLDIDAGQTAGEGTGRPRVAVGADGNAVVTWAETHPDGRRRLFARRVTELRASAVPQEVSLPSLGAAVGGDADSADIAIEDDVSFAWVVWRQDFGGVSRAIARRLVGSLFEAPAPVDGWAATGAFRAPRVSMNGDGVGLAASQSDAGEVGVAVLARDAFGPAAPLAGGASSPLVAAAEDRDVAVAWHAGGRLWGARIPRDAELEPSADLGAGAAPTELAGDGAGDFAVAYQRGDQALVAVWDEAPSRASLRTSRVYKNLTRPLLRWGPATELWGAPAYRVVLDGRPLATTTSESLTPPAPLSDGVHRWYVESIDRRGQVTRSAARPVRVDTRRPQLRVAVRGPRSVGAVLRVFVRASDAAAGIGGVRVDFGDGSPPATVGPFAHRYGRRGAYTLRVRVADHAGNRARRSVRVRIR